MKKLTTIALAIALSGCATQSLLESPSHQTKTTQKVLVEDRVVAFGRPASGTHLSQSNVVIVGKAQSYVLTDGGHQLVNLISSLPPKNFSVNNNLEFYSANDGKFSGKMSLSYARLKDEISRKDMQLLLQNGAKECSSESDARMNAQRFCFNINISGTIYPRVSNYELVRSQFSPLTRPYSVKIYTAKETQTTGRTGAEKLVLLPFCTRL